MKKITIPLFVVALALVFTPLAAVAQTPESQTAQAEAAEAAALRQVALQVEEAERQLNYLALLVQKLALEKQAMGLQKQLAVFSAPKPAQSLAKDAPMKVVQEIAKEEKQTEGPAENIFTQADDIEESPADDPPAGGQKQSVFAAGLSPFKSIQNMGTPQLAALTILAILAVFILVRRFRGRKQEPKGSAPVSMSPSSQTFSQPQQPLLQEGRQELKENVVWK